MYDENSMKNHIFWIKFRRVFLLILFTIIGTALGVVISDYVVNILLFPAILRIIIVVISAVLFLGMALIFTANTGKEIEDSYWKIAVYKKLSIISKKLDNLENPDNIKSHKNSHEQSKKVHKEIEKNQIQENTETTSSQSEDNSNTEILEELKVLSETLEDTEKIESTQK